MQLNSNKHLLTASEVFENADFPLFTSDKKRIQYMKNTYANMPLAKAFSIFYGIDVTNEVKDNKAINNVTTIELGQTLLGTVKEFNKTHIVFEVPGVKEEIVCKENLWSAYDAIQSYLMTHNNKLLFEVRAKENNTYFVSIINAYYKSWVNIINKAIQHEDGIEVHIDSLVQGGYLCHTAITTLNNLTGRNYTHSVFIPGSHIVLNIEHDFDKWVGEDVVIIPQKFVEFKKNYKTGEVENSLVGSRKRVLQIKGMQNLADMYNMWRLSLSDNVKYTPTTYEGIVTGIINAKRKCGVFVELENEYITGLLPISSYDLLDYHPGDHVYVQINQFEVQEGKPPFITNKAGKVIKSNTRPVFKLAL